MRKKGTKSFPNGSVRYTPLSESELKRAIVGDAPSKPLSKTELSLWLNVTTRFLECEVRDGRLRAIKLGKRAVRFLPSDIAKWMNAHPSLQDEAA